MQNRKKKHSYAIFPYRNRNRNKFINQIRAPGGHIQITIMIDTQQQYIKLNIRSEISIIVVHFKKGRGGGYYNLCGIEIKIVAMLCFNVIKSIYMLLANY